METATHVRFAPQRDGTLQTPAQSPAGTRRTMVNIAINAKKRVLIVDDSVVVRKALPDILSRDAELEVAELLSNGRLALAKLQPLQPDVIPLDIEVPEIIMFSTLTERERRRRWRRFPSAPPTTSPNQAIWMPRPLRREHHAASGAEDQGSLSRKWRATCLAWEGDSSSTALPVPAALPLPIRLRS